jgi:hypothetical protein
MPDNDLIVILEPLGRETSSPVSPSAGVHSGATADDAGRKTRRRRAHESSKEESDDLANDGPQHQVDRLA